MFSREGTQALRLDEEKGSAMGTYYNPGIDVINGRVGHRLNTFLYDSAMGSLRPGEHLYACIEFTTHTVAVCVDEFTEFRQISELLCSYTLHALSELEHARSV